MQVSPQRINRNIVECKVVHETATVIICDTVLIETLWNVKCTMTRQETL